MVSLHIRGRDYESSQIHSSPEQPTDPWAHPVEKPLSLQQYAELARRRTYERVEQLLSHTEPLILDGLDIPTSDSSAPVKTGSEQNAFPAPATLPTSTPQRPRSAPRVLYGPDPHQEQTERSRQKGHLIELRRSGSLAVLHRTELAHDPIIAAIEQRRLLKFLYDEELYTVKPAAYGRRVGDGRLALSALEIYPDECIWRTFTVADMLDVTMLSQGFHEDPIGYVKGTSDIYDVFVELDHVSHPLHDILVRAIEEQLMLTFDYDGLPRVVKPMSYGYTDEEIRQLHAFQIDGETSQDEGLPQWRNFLLDKMQNVEIGAHFEEVPADYKASTQRHRHYFKYVFCENRKRLVLSML